ncbi:MAG: hypothetical protein JJE52_01910 [Acidimicrobiia bacterium]|nr:hypothetical protein [Acidimicrobiia bacterium]
MGVPSKFLKVLFALALVMGVAACGDDSESADDAPANADAGVAENTDDEKTDDGNTDDEKTDDANTDDATGSEGGEVVGDTDIAGLTTGGAGSLTLADETIELETRCYLEEQVAGGMTMEYTAQGVGTDADGEAIMLDVTRFAEEEGAVIVGDSVSITLGDPLDINSTTLSYLPLAGMNESDLVDRDGGNVTGTGVELINDDTGDQVVVSFELAC